MQPPLHVDVRQIADHPSLSIVPIVLVECVRLWVLDGRRSHECGQRRAARKNVLHDNHLDLPVPAMYTCSDTRARTYTLPHITLTRCWWYLTALVCSLAYDDFAFLLVPKSLFQRA